MPFVWLLVATVTFPVARLHTFCSTTRFAVITRCVARLPRLYVVDYAVVCYVGCVAFVTVWTLPRSFGCGLRWLFTRTFTRLPTVVTRWVRIPRVVPVGALRLRCGFYVARLLRLLVTVGCLRLLIYVYPVVYHVTLRTGTRLQLPRLLRTFACHVGIAVYVGAVTFARLRFTFTLILLQLHTVDWLRLRLFTSCTGYTCILFRLRLIYVYAICTFGYVCVYGYFTLLI